MSSSLVSEQNVHSTPTACEKQRAICGRNGTHAAKSASAIASAAPAQKRAPHDAPSDALEREPMAAAQQTLESRPAAFEKRSFDCRYA